MRPAPPGSRGGGDAEGARADKIISTATEGVFPVPRTGECPVVSYGHAAKLSHHKLRSSFLPGPEFVALTPIPRYVAAEGTRSIYPVFVSPFDHGQELVGEIVVEYGQ